MASAASDSSSARSTRVKRLPRASPGDRQIERRRAGPGGEADAARAHAGRAERAQNLVHDLARHGDDLDRDRAALRAGAGNDAVAEIDALRRKRKMPRDLEAQDALQLALRHRRQRDALGQDAVLRNLDGDRPAQREPREGGASAPPVSPSSGAARSIWPSGRWPRRSSQ